jgi:hypothetical protein
MPITARAAQFHRTSIPSENNEFGNPTEQRNGSAENGWALDY